VEVYGLLYRPSRWCKDVRARAHRSRTGRNKEHDQFQLPSGVPSKRLHVLRYRVSPPIGDHGFMLTIVGGRKSVLDPILSQETTSWPSKQTVAISAQVNLERNVEEVLDYPPGSTASLETLIPLLSRSLPPRLLQLLQRPLQHPPPMLRSGKPWAVTSTETEVVHFQMVIMTRFRVDRRT
jgi:hypothetical protein